ncbi:TetR family transcriptional regulator [Pseudomonas sp. TTU2014-080ASC]|uniref:TetR family transcriptional regulator n=1 Tax=Pseudomonas sp. TTU2014-080ASC TaxID=1729724 RepID=UPI00071883A9|nr:TetR family transcriptional regulator [Pseudomonas sp. TTU2014-080ASC]KRW59973.1 TetR family transcriptional regulator [Pseudomonas sp. TTU2014-080ASC]
MSSNETSNGTSAPGKQSLIDAALRLTSTSRSISSVGLRELAREAGLNPNTFYRHFRDVDDLGLTIIRQIAAQLRQPLCALRREAAERAELSPSTGAKLFGIDLQRGRLVCHETVELFFDFVEQNPEAFMVGVRELHGPSPVLRVALAELMHDFAEDMAEDIIAYKLLPDMLTRAQVLEISSLISRNLFQAALDYIGFPERRQAVRAMAEEQIVMLFTGASVLQSMGQLQLADLSK